LEAERLGGPREDRLVAPATTVGDVGPGRLDRVRLDAQLLVSLAQGGLDAALAALAGAAWDRPRATLVGPPGPELQQGLAVAGDEQPCGSPRSPVRVPEGAGGPAHGRILSRATRAIA